MTRTATVPVEYTETAGYEWRGYVVYGHATAEGCRDWDSGGRDDPSWDDRYIRNFNCWITAVEDGETGAELDLGAVSEGMLSSFEDYMENELLGILNDDSVWEEDTDYDRD